MGRTAKDLLNHCLNIFKDWSVLLSTVGSAWWENSTNRQEPPILLDLCEIRSVNQDEEFLGM